MDLRLLVYDATCRELGVGLSDAWYAGSVLYRALGRFDHVLGARSWHEAWHWLAEIAPGERIAEVQYWGHGNWGNARLGGERLDIDWLEPRHAQAAALNALRDRLASDALFWFRTCETFGAERGQDFARAFVDRFGCRAAGHTFIIGWWQSGLHSLAPGEVPTWPNDEGLRDGTPNAPERARWSQPWAPNTVSCLRGHIPDGF
jgi:hypothetical protein